MMENYGILITTELIWYKLLVVLKVS